MLKRNAIGTGAVIAACTAMSMFSTGCRAMPGMGLFAARGPSAEALAGNGPSTTYPVPPSHTATPEAIASIAGGTAAPNSPSSADVETAQVTGFEISPGYALPAGASPSGPQANLAAAQANGVYGVGGGSNTAAAPSFASSPTPNPTPTSALGTAPSVDMPSGYTFGTKAMTPKPTSTNFAASATTEPASNFAPPSGPLTPPSTTSQPLPTASYTQPPSGGGFTLPSDAPAMAAITSPPSGAASTDRESAAVEMTAPGFAPSFSTAQAPEPASTSLAPSFSGPSQDGGYMPGSTGSSGGYPTSDTKPNTSGSYYR